MPNSAEGYAVDTSVAVAALDAGHAAHAACRAAVTQYRPALAGHAAFETYSVLTRMPGPLAIGPPVAADAIRLLTRDQRARRTYDLVGVDDVLVG